MTQDTPNAEQPSDDLVAEILRRDTEIRERAPVVPKSRSRLPWLLALLVVGIAVTAWNVVRLRRPVEVFTGAERVASAEARLMLTSVAIAAFRDSAGRLPQSLDEAGLTDEEDVSYRLEDGLYRLIIQVQGRAIEYQSGEDIGRLVKSFEAMSIGGVR
ncbi:MAG: hypothetical protein AABY91_00205 [Gemmatimonadota bacterium]